MSSVKQNPQQPSIFATSVAVNVEAEEVVLDFFQTSSAESVEKSSPIQRIVMDKETADRLRESLDLQHVSNNTTDASARLRALFERLDALPDDEEGLTYERLRELRSEADKRLDRLYGTSDG